MTHTDCRTRSLVSNTCSITEPPLNPGPRNPTAGLARAPMRLASMRLASMLLDLMLLDLMFLDLMLLLMVLRTMSLASAVVLPLARMLLWDVMLRVSTVMMRWPVALGCVRVRSRCCSNN